MLLHTQLPNHLPLVCVGHVGCHNGNGRNHFRRRRHKHAWEGGTSKSNYVHDGERLEPPAAAHKSATRLNVMSIAVQLHYWGFPKIRGTVLGVAIIRTIRFYIGVPLFRETTYYSIRNENLRVQFPKQPRPKP